MRSFSAADLLSLWERGASWHAIDQALLVLRHLLPECSYDELAALSLGQRDGLLLQAHRQVFGDRLDAYAECPQCQERLEFSLSCALLASKAMPSETRAKTVTVQGARFNLRSPNSRDAAAAAAGQDLNTAKEILLRRCVAPTDGSMQDLEVLAESTVNAIAAELASMDPAAETLLDLSCPVCGHIWQEVFEIMTFLWTEIRARARRLLQEVDALARAYGWLEADILAMSETRRGLYLQMAVA
jgi:hypothetical protein